MTIDELEQENLRLRSEVLRLRNLLDRDRTGLARALALVRGEVCSHGWLAERGNWGCYEWNERAEIAFRTEVAAAFDVIDRLAEEALRESGKRASQAYHPEE